MYMYLVYTWISQVVHSSLQAMVAREVRPSDPELAKPEEEEVEKVRALDSDLCSHHFN